MWNLDTNCATSASLKELGLVVKLKNIDGFYCECSTTTGRVKGLEVIHTNGIHHISVHTCRNGPSPEELLTNRLYPASEKTPTRAFSFDFLIELDLMNLFGYINIKQAMDMKSAATPKNQRRTGTKQNDAVSSL